MHCWSSCRVAGYNPRHAFWNESEAIAARQPSSFRRGRELRLRTFRVPLKADAYPIWIGSGARRRIPEALRAGGDPPEHVHVVTDALVASHHGRGLLGIIRRAGFKISATIVPSGEASKSVRELTRVWRDCIRAGCDRRSVVLAFGGGVVGDLGGFAAASLLRGARFLQVPTTLLAMVDASVGGKTGINLPEGKNLVGAFHQPIGVVMDLDFLRTLPPRETRAGWAEVLKTAAIRDAAFFGQLERDRRRFLGGDRKLVAKAVERTARIKAQVVGADEKESGLRKILNFGHTLAHAIETTQRYGGLLHGEAVAVGMVFAARLGEALGHTAPGVAARLESLVRFYGLPASARGLSVRKLIEAMGRDKKRGSRGIQWVFLERIGRTRLVDSVPTERVEAELASFLKTGK